MRLSEVLVRELQNLGDLAAAGHVPWDCGTPDAAILAGGVESAARLFGGLCRQRPEDDGPGSLGFERGRCGW